MTSDAHRLPVAALLFCSGFCALIYQTVWLREFRLIFGASTAASAAVLGIFMGGLGLGSAWLGRRAEAATRPLLFYGNLEVLIALSAALTPGLVWLVRQLYAATGGTMVLGHGAGTAVRLLLAALVLIVPTFLMGGTLPAAARSVESDDDLGRRSLALLYGCNTLGAVTGAALSTFWLVEIFGNRQTLWLACVLNILVALVARVVSRTRPEIPATAPTEIREGAAAPRFVVFAATLVGFAFMLMELVWYRMLGPILGGSTFTFGLILVVALLGIGLGGAAYSFRRAESSATLRGFALTCALEALCLALPYALGDRLALLALMLRGLGTISFAGQVFGWSIVTAIVVLPAAIVAGYQFPLLIGLLGQGRADVARHTGLAYAANTAGAIVGSLAGGFGLLPLLTAPGVWKVVTVLLALLALLQIRRASIGAMLAAAAAIALVFTPGPSAVWRHSGIGAGRSDPKAPSGNFFHEWANFIRRSVIWEAEGVESSVALMADSGLAFVINGKIDGNSRLDAGTQVMAGMMGAVLLPAPKRALVIGLGTGSTAGWLGKVESMESVDAIELEPAIIEVARRCAAVNADVLNNPKVHLHIGDAREVLLTTPNTYDIIFSEPSNPYRAGIASLFTREFYQAVEHRLAPGGVFLQWLQAYDIDGQAVRNVYATLGSVFPRVQTWRTQAGDLLLVATREPLDLDADTLRQRIAREPLRGALFNAWRVDSLEGVFAHFVANESLTRAVVESGEPISTDDRNALEFGFARTVGRRKEARVVEDVMEFAQARGFNRPQKLRGQFDWNIAVALQPTTEALVGSFADPIAGESALRVAHRTFLHAYSTRDFARAREIMAREELEPLSPFEIEVMAEVLISAGDGRALPLIEKIAARRASDAEGLRGCLLAAQRRYYEPAGEALLAAFSAWQTDAWAHPAVVSLALTAAQTVAREGHDPALALRLFRSLQKPFAVNLLRERRLAALVEIARRTEANPLNAQLREALAAYAEQPVWQKEFLQQRAIAYRALNDPLVERAALDFRKFLDREPLRFDEGLPQSEPPKLGQN
jgi:spermidine synthase